MSAPDALISESLVTGRDLGAIRGERVLFRTLSIEVAPGEAVLLRGANGSGKTTLLRMLAGLSRPDAGNVTRQGACHWVGHRSGVKPHESPRRHLSHWARVWGSEADIAEVLGAMGLSLAADVAGRGLSAGQMRRTALARLKLKNRPLWLLDEPFNALDADGRALLSEMIALHRKAGGAVIAALHGEAPFEASREVAL